MATLIPKDGYAALDRLQLQPGVNTLGRRDTNQLTLTDPSVSGLHCEITIQDGEIKIRDVGSTNGTFVDEQRVQEAKLAHGQHLRLGHMHFVVDAPEFAATPAALRVSLGH
jgi:pSer/pThr/pTyr-binding forkhead associated (FHA) protein